MLKPYASAMSTQSFDALNAAKYRRPIRSKPRTLSARAVYVLSSLHLTHELNERHSRIRYPPMDCTVRLRGDRCPTKSDLEIGIE
jgi:hypothetical protein